MARFVDRWPRAAQPEGLDRPKGSMARRPTASGARIRCRSTSSALKTGLCALAPMASAVMGANPNVNGGAACDPVRLPDFEDFAEATRILG